MVKLEVKKVKRLIIWNGAVACFLDPTGRQAPCFPTVKEEKAERQQYNQVDACWKATVIYRPLILAGFAAWLTVA